ncbi:hypothetical protein M5K25_019633 [Dendrobium thyrsiflorum]|uniref:Uncharacterized protein n=1 Tax=Dendrobium thyrsiflorum TaxID=117978 RepID=A0ABD0UMM9_DENTH
MASKDLDLSGFLGLETDVDRRLMEIIKEAAKEGALVLYTLAGKIITSGVQTYLYVRITLYRVTRYRAVPSTDYCTESLDPSKAESAKQACKLWLNRAHIVLVGVSRTGKTPLSIYLAQKVTRWQIELSERQRPRPWDSKGDMMSNYSDMEHVREELEFAKRIFAQNPVWPVRVCLYSNCLCLVLVSEITGKAIEETAAVIVRIYNCKSRHLCLDKVVCTAHSASKLRSSSGAALRLLYAIGVSPIY